jgi:large subunit ribosomal protein L28e
VISKKPAAANKPASGLYTVTYGGNKTARKSVQTGPEERRQKH